MSNVTEISVGPGTGNDSLGICRHVAGLQKLDDSHVPLFAHGTWVLGNTDKAKHTLNLAIRTDQALAAIYPATKHTHRIGASHCCRSSLLALVQGAGLDALEIPSRPGAAPAQVLEGRKDQTTLPARETETLLMPRAANHTNQTEPGGGKQQKSACQKAGAFRKRRQPNDVKPSGQHHPDRAAETSSRLGHQHGQRNPQPAPI